MMTAAEYFGGAVRQSISGTFTLDYRYRVWCITASAGGFGVRFPVVTEAYMPIGIPVFIIVNVGSFTFNVRDTEATLASINVAANRAVFVNSYTVGGAKKWAHELTRVWTSY